MYKFILNSYNIYMRYKKLKHCAYLVQYHIIWCPKFRFNILNEDISKSLRDILFFIADKYNYEILELEIMEDHIHLFVGALPTVSPTEIVRTLKSISAIKLFRQYPKLKQFYSRCGSLWGKGYFVSTIGKVSEETIRRYILEQNSK